MRHYSKVDHDTWHDSQVRHGLFDYLRILWVESVASTCFICFLLCFYYKASFDVLVTQANSIGRNRDFLEGET